jgi:hypothetical protein
MASKIIVDQLEKSGYTTLTLPSANATANQYIKNDGAGALSWATLPASGKILKVYENNLNTSVSSSSTSYVASGLTITTDAPASTGSKFLLTLSGGTWANGSDGYQGFVTFYVDGSEVGDAGPYEEKDENHNGNAYVGHSASCLHSPSTVSAVTYTVYYKAESGSTTYFNRASARTVFTVMEIGA